MHPELEQLLNDVIKDIPGSYLAFKQKIIELKNGFNFCKYVDYMSRQTLVDCSPEALLDLGYIIANNYFITDIPASLEDITKEPPVCVNFKNIYNQIKIAAVSNLGAQGALFQILNMNNSRLLENAGLDAENEFQMVVTLFENKKNCPVDQKKFSHINEAIILASDLADDKNVIRALTQYKASAERGLAPAHTACGLLYENHTEIEEDWPQAVFHYEAAAKQLHCYGIFNHGWMLQFGLGVAINHSQATQCYLTSAYLGCPEAQYHLAMNYEKGIGLPKSDMEQALYWYDQAILQNYSNAIFHKGWLYEKGLGVPQNLALAAKHYVLAAKQSDFRVIARGALKFLVENPQFNLNETGNIEIGEVLATTPLNELNNASDKMAMAKWFEEAEYADEAIKLYGKIIKQFPTYAKAYLARAKAYIEVNQNPGLIITDLEQNIKLDPKPVNALKELIHIYDNEGLYKDVIFYCTKLLAIDDEKYSEYYRFRAVAHHELAIANNELKEYNLAIKDYTAYLNKNSDNADTYLERATAYVELEEYKPAIKDYTSYLSQYPDDAKVYRARAAAYKNIHWHKAAQKDLALAQRIENSQIPKIKKSSLPLITVLPKLLTSNKCEIPKNLELFSQNLFKIFYDQQRDNCLILQLIPLKDVAEILMKQIHNTQHSFRICDLSKLQEVILATTKTLLQKFYVNVVVSGETIEITATEKDHKIINGKPVHELNQLKTKIIQALPEFQLHQKISILKDQYFQRMKSISLLENKLDTLLQTVKTNYGKKHQLIQTIIAYDGGMTSTQKIILPLQQIVKKVERFINDASAQLSSRKTAEFDKIFHSFENQTGNEFIQSIEELLYQMELKYSQLHKLCHPNHKNLNRTLLQLISQFNEVQANERKTTETKTLNEVISEDEKKEDVAEIKTFDVTAFKDDELNADSDDELEEQEMLKLLPPGLLKESKDDDNPLSFFRHDQVLFNPNNSSRSESTALLPPGNNQIHSPVVTQHDENTIQSTNRPCRS